MGHQPSRLRPRPSPAAAKETGKTAAREPVITSGVNALPFASVSFTGVSQSLIKFFLMNTG